MLRILYFGSSQSGATSKHRADALTRIGCIVALHDPFAGLATSLFPAWKSKFHYHTGYRFLQRTVHAWLMKILQRHQSCDLIWVDGGELFGRAAVSTLRASGVPLVLFNHDDPTGARDKSRFYSLVRALPLFDVVTAVRDESEAEMRAKGVPKVLRIWRTYDEVRHNAAADEVSSLNSDVCFIGTFIRNESRDEFLLRLVDRGVNISIWGDGWNKSLQWERIQAHWRGPSLTGMNYVAAMRGAKVCLGLLSKGNRDQHTTRSMEIPYAGGLLCAERTSEHLALFKEDEEAVFWSDADECATKCIDLLQDDQKRERIRLAGSSRIKRNKVGNEDICKTILTAAGFK